MYIANATGCSSIWGGSSPSTPYTVNDEGHGPAWANSLFEDNAEYGYGMFLGVTARRERLADIMKKFAEADLPAAWGLKEAAAEWLEGKDNAEASKAAAAKLVPALEKAVAECGSCGCEFDALYKEALKDKDMLVKKSFWMFGGDGWAYDIGFGGVDHVLASGEDVNVHGLRHRGVFQHRRPGLQGHPDRLRRPVRRGRQGDQEEGSRRHRHELRLCLRGADCHGRRYEPDPEGHPGG